MPPLVSVGDTLLDHPPYYAGVDAAWLDPSAPFRIFPVAYQPGASQDAFFDPGHTEEMQALFDAMNDDLPDRALVWQTALRTLVEQLTDRSPTALHAQQGRVGG